MPSSNVDKLNWQRIEPRPSTPKSVEIGLMASVHDPLWFLARQWQFGEFKGEDAASPMLVEIKARYSTIDPLRIEGETTPIHNSKPIEVIGTSEPFKYDWATAVELGQLFKDLLDKSIGLDSTTIYEKFLDEYRLVFPRQTGFESHEEEVFYSICKDTVDGIRLFKDTSKPDDLRTILNSFSNEQQKIIKEILELFKDWVQDVFGDLNNETNNQFSDKDSPSWKPERLEYELQSSAKAENDMGDVTTINFNIYPERDGTLEWYTYDFQSEVNVTLLNEEKPRRLLPIRVEFSGMPNKRLWKIEDYNISFPQIQPELREIGKLIVLDFMLIYGHDWFVVPFEQSLGSLYQIENLSVRDVFGGVTPIKRVETTDRECIEEEHGKESYKELPSAEKWSMFTTTSGNGSDFANYLIFPSTISATMIESEPIEDVFFIRDEMANYVWAIEHIAENNLGTPLRLDEKLKDSDESALQAQQLDDKIPLKYVIQTGVPPNWIPFIPWKIDNPVDDNSSQIIDIALERGTMFGDDGELLHPKSRILKPTNLDEPIHKWSDKKVYRIREEEVPRAGTRISRLIRLSRWIDGSTHLWISRRRRTGRGEGQSNLGFDRVVPNVAKGE